MSKIERKEKVLVVAEIKLSGSCVQALYMPKEYTKEEMLERLKKYYVENGNKFDTTPVLDGIVINENTVSLTIVDEQEDEE